MTTPQASRAAKALNRLHIAAMAARPPGKKLPGLTLEGREARRLNAMKARAAKLRKRAGLNSA